MTDVIRWAEVDRMFGSKMPNGSCNAVVEIDDAGEIVCGYPRRSDGTCMDGHPAEPPPLAIASPATTHRPETTTDAREANPHG